MASRAEATTALLLSVNLLLFTLVSSYSPYCPPPSPPIKPPPVPSPMGGYCPRDALKLGVCVDLLKDLLRLKIGEPPKNPCCSLIADLADLEAAVCLCTVIKASVLRAIKLDLPVNLSLLLNYCGKKVPKGFQCA